ncbi:MAG: TIGR02646 family protein [Fimbriimonadaceae bacterium]
MRAITKGAEPSSLTVHRQTRYSDYANYIDKASLRYSLLTEQRGICCYCMGRIRIGEKTMKIEHWRCQSRFTDEQLSYDNLLGACLGGGDNQPPNLQHCDARKGNRDLRFNPANSSHRVQTRLRYEANGCIRSDDPVFDKQLESVLNLNLAFLKNNRKGVLDAVLEWWKYEKNHGVLQKADFKKKRDKYTGGSGELNPFCQVAVWWLEQRLARMTP